MVTMARRQTNGWLMFLKWLLIPASLAAVGYFFMGPLVPKLLPGRAPITTPESTTSGGEEKKTYSEPDVEVSVKPASDSYRSRSSSDRPRRRKKRRRTTTTQPRVDTAPVEAPVQDDPPVESPPDSDGGLLETEEALSVR